MRYYLDTEHNGHGGRLISLALVREDGISLYLVYPSLELLEPWVRTNVFPLIRSVPKHVEVQFVEHLEGANEIMKFLAADRTTPIIITDWPTDVAYFCGAITTGPGKMVNIEHLAFEILRVDAYPTTLPDAVQHNAWWDAMALRHLLGEVANDPA